MGELIDLQSWRRASVEQEGGDGDIRRLELAVSRLDAVASAQLEEAGSLEPSIETELLAILGALAGDLVDEAASRAERLAARLSKRAGSM
jgi:hypothetical protein